MGRITIVGLGPMGENGLTKEALDIIHNGNPNFLRTDQHESISYFTRNQIPYVSFDEYYDTMTNFDEIYSSIAQKLIEEAKERDINYFVPGHPLMAEKTVLNIIESGWPYRMVNGMSFLEPVLSIVGRDPINGLKLVDGDNFSDLDLDIHSDTIITQVYNQRIVSRIKIAIGEIYGDTHEVYLISHGGIAEKEEVHKLPAYELDRVANLTHETSIFLPKIEEDLRYDFKDLIKITRRLRGEDGCPWDMEQTHKSMKANLIEEAYEVAYAIESEDMFALEEELGDLLFQIIFHGDIASEEGHFNLTDITSGISNKLIRRHPHVFSNGEADWDRIKMEETNIRSIQDRLKHLEGLPSLLHGQKALRLLKKEDLIEGLQVNKDLDLGSIDEKNFGDFLLLCLLKAEEMGIDAESALKQTLMSMSKEL